MNIDLPGEMDGIAATRKIKAFDRDAKIIIVTNYDKSDLRAEAGKAGACGYVLKDNLLDVSELLQSGQNHQLPSEQNSQVHSIMEDTNDINFVASERNSVFGELIENHK